MKAKSLLNIQFSHGKETKITKIQSSIRIFCLCVSGNEVNNNKLERHHFNFFSAKFLSTPEIVLKSFLEHISCACVVRFARLALTQAGSCKENSTIICYLS